MTPCALPTSCHASASTRATTPSASQASCCALAAAGWRWSRTAIAMRKLSACRSSLSSCNTASVSSSPATAAHASKQGLATGQAAADARIQQFIQQERIRGEAFGQQGTAGHDVDQPLQRRGLFIEQCQVGTAAQDVLQQGQEPAQRQHRVLRTRRPLQQRRQHAIEARARRIRQPFHARTAGEITQQAVGLLGFGEAGSAQFVGIACIGQRMPVRRQRAGVSALCRGASSASNSAVTRARCASSSARKASQPV
jgi:hypothetical protein